MYTANVEVLSKSAEEFKRERHLPDAECGQRAVEQAKNREWPARGREGQGGWMGLHFREKIEWNSEDLMLLGLLLWQFFSGERDWLLCAVLLFLLLFD